MGWWPWLQLDAMQAQLNRIEGLLKDQGKIAALDADVRKKTAQLLAAVKKAGPGEPEPLIKETRMAASVDQLVTDVAAEDAVIDSAIVLLNGITARIDAAVSAALAGGATAAELAPLSTLSTDIKAKTKALSDAVVANTSP